MPKPLPKPGSPEALSCYCACDPTLDSHTLTQEPDGWTAWKVEVLNGPDGRPVGLGKEAVTLDLSACPLHGDRPGDELPEGI